MAAKNSPATGQAERELVLTRVFDAPRELVFKLWTDPKHLARWWGPKGFTNPVCEVDARPGGALRIVMRGPDGAEYPMIGVFREIAPPERLVFTNVAVDQEGKPLLDGLTTVTFAEDGGKTTLTMHTRAVALVPYAAAYLQGMEAGWTQSLERLEAHVAQARKGENGATAKETSPAEGATGPDLVLTRIFDAPRGLVFAAWTKQEHLERWQGAPQGFTVTTHHRDLRPGGAYRLCMRSPEGVDHWLQGVYREIVEPERLVFTHVWLDAQGKPGRETLVTILFAERGGKTELTLHQTGFKSVESRDGHEKGWTSTLDRLAEYLVKA